MMPLSQSLPAPAAGLSHVTEAERQLVRDLDALLAKRPQFGLRPAVTSTIHPSPSVTALAPGTAALADDEDDAADFDWVGLADAKLAGKPSAEAAGAAQWVHKARRERLVDKSRHAFAWAITLLIGGAVVTGSAYLLLGTIPSFEQLVALGQRTFH
jgi:hypothetical protein